MLPFARHQAYARLQCLPLTRLVRLVPFPNEALSANGDVRLGPVADHIALIPERLHVGRIGGLVGALLVEGTQHIEGSF